jgi:N-acetylglucosaminyldiphosphoundecaprenol N-acetyl-beta-D-mannosaminyltransferase
LTSPFSWKPSTSLFVALGRPDAGDLVVTETREYRSERGNVSKGPRQTFRRIQIAGCPVDDASVDETLSFVDRCIETRASCRHGFINAAKVVSIQKDHRFREALRTCDLLSPDGMSIVWASRLLGMPLPERVNGTNLMWALVQRAADRGYRVFFLGASDDVIRLAVEIFSQRFPPLVIAGYRNGYFSRDEEPEVAAQITESRADILLVGFGSPMKELWLERWVPTMRIPFCMGVGGSFDVVVGRVRRAPDWVQQMGMEWAYRLVQEPRRMWKRYLLGNWVFLYLIARHMIRDRVNSSRVLGHPR